MSNSVWPHRRQPTRLPRPWDSPGKNTGGGCHFLLQCMKVKSESEVTQSCLTPSGPMDCSPPGSCATTTAVDLLVGNLVRNSNLIADGIHCGIHKPCANCSRNMCKVVCYGDECRGWVATIPYQDLNSPKLTINCGKFWKRWEYQATWPASWETCMQVRKQQLELDMEKQTGSK